MIAPRDTPQRSVQTLLDRLAHRHTPLAGMGMTSIVLGLIALLLFFLPILGLPMSVFGLCFGLVGLIGAFFSKTTSLRSSLLGILTCSTALVVNAAVAYAPAGYLPARGVPELWRIVPGRPYVPPPEAR